MKLVATLFLAAFVASAAATGNEPAMPAQPAQPARPAAPESFEDRVLLAEAAESDEQSRTYQGAMRRRAGRHLARTMRSCAAGMPKGEEQGFVLVAYITPAGKARAVEVKPATDAAQCFARGFASVSYPKPPAYPERPGFPVLMKVRLTR